MKRRAGSFSINSVTRLKMSPKNGVAKDPKSAFQELVQGKGLKTPRYHTEMLPKTAISGEQHFRARVMVDGREVATGIGESKSKAQKNAAAKASRIVFERRASAIREFNVSTTYIRNWSKRAVTKCRFFE